MTRSFLFVPADSEKKLSKAASCDADALILDLEDSVAASERPAARRLARDFLLGERAQACWVRINPLDSEDASKDLEAVLRARPDGVVLPKAAGAETVAALHERLEAAEVEYGFPKGAIGVLPIVTETPAALFRLASYVEAPGRLAGLTWGAEDLAAAVGARATRDEQGQWLGPYQLARSLCLFAAAAARVPAIDTVYTDFRDSGGLADYAAAARRDGFAGMLAIHPGQLAVINEAFLPTETEIAEARRIVDLFDRNPGAGTLGLDGRMVDRPHWVAAKRTLEIAKRSRSG